MRPKGLRERRASPRRTHRECGWLVAARLRPGRDVRLLNLSSGGALVEAGVRLMPGSPFVLHLTGVESHHTIRGTVLRCHVSALQQEDGVRYRAALVFDRHFRVPEHTAIRTAQAWTNAVGG
jgi:hypothetical protein